MPTRITINRNLFPSATNLKIAFERIVCEEECSELKSLKNYEAELDSLFKVKSSYRASETFLGSLRVNDEAEEGEKVLSAHAWSDKQRALVKLFNYLDQVIMSTPRLDFDKSLLKDFRDQAIKMLQAINKNSDNLNVESSNSVKNNLSTLSQRWKPKSNQKDKADGEFLQKISFGPVTYGRFSRYYNNYAAMPKDDRKLMLGKLYQVSMENQTREAFLEDIEHRADGSFLLEFYNALEGKFKLDSRDERFDIQVV